MIWLWLGCGSSAPLPDQPFEIPVKDPSTVRFIAIGDTGKGNDRQREVAEAMASVCASRGCDFVVFLGDNLYPDGMVTDDDPRMDEVMTDIYTHLDVPHVLTLGNHDWGRQHYVANADRQVAWAQRHEKFVLPQKYFRFQAGDTELWSIDSDAVFWEGVEPQGSWLDSTMERSEARWKVVFGHHTYRSDGPHGNAGLYDGWSFVPYVSGNSLLTFFEDHVVPGADVYLAGHDHSLQAFAHDGLELVVSGAGASTTPLYDHGNDRDLAFSMTGFAWISLGTEMEIALYDQEKRLLGTRTRPHRGRGGKAVAQ